MKIIDKAQFTVLYNYFLGKIFDSSSCRPRVCHTRHTHSVDCDNVDNVTPIFLHVLMKGLVHHVPSPVQVCLDNGIEPFLTNVFGSGVKLSS